MILLFRWTTLSNCIRSSMTAGLAFKQPPIGFPLNSPMLAAGYDGIRPLVVQQGKNLIRIVSTIGYPRHQVNSGSRNPLHNRSGCRPLLHTRVDAKSVYKCMNILLAIVRWLEIAAPFCPSAMLVNTENGGINHDAFGIGLGG